ncbi:hypothetical protein PAXINDRAFT_14703 [Paxillus involutus ATCC 200175]|uniref:Unplaced genomic scaffold PAXINscaffold_41, whole genome shotgun sequence n=1 Tax=Paxillus involutus ATCC 200175 TaxID=664439 RepID=A0A0C9TYX7_PAXIN|nr:hypothetical protein PAXINDRAFT_14703 [Paxillus involutus ATCC 200175]
MPKTTKEHANTKEFHQFHHQLFHSSLSMILQSLKPGMSKPEVMCLAFHSGLNDQALYRCREHMDTPIGSFGPGQLWEEYGIVGQLVPFTNNFPRADIHELLSPDLLHQIIKGTFKDHLVDWVESYLKNEHGTSKANIILDNIDRRSSMFFTRPSFQTVDGDDSKALMKVYIAAIEGYVPQPIVQAFQVFLKFCYLVWCDILAEDTLNMIQDALDCFHHYHKAFGPDVVATFSLPRQHSMKHYTNLICLFSAPNGLCLSITESKHIKAVKEPYQLSNHHNTLGQMLLMNQRLDKLNANEHGWVIDFAEELHITQLPELLQQFLFLMDHPDDPQEMCDIPLIKCPQYNGKIKDASPIDEEPTITYEALYPRPSTPPPINDMSERPTELKVGTPTHFGGNTNDSSQWLHSVMAYLILNERIYNFNDKKVILALSFMSKGTAAS